MKVPKHFEIKKRMARVARPVLKVLLCDVESQKREKILRRVVGKSVEANKYVLNALSEKNRDLGLGDTEGYYNRLTGNIGLTENPAYAYCAHEMIHKLGKYFLNDYNTANAISAYLLTTDYIKELVANPEKLANPPVDFDSLSHETKDQIEAILKPEKVQEATLKESLVASNEYKSGHHLKGYALGVRAAEMDVKTKIPGAGLFYLRLVNQGLPIDAAERLVLSKSVSGMSEFAEKYGKRWNKILQEDKQIFERMVEDEVNSGGRK